MAQIFKFPICRVSNVSSINPESLVRDLLSSSDEELNRTISDLKTGERQKVEDMITNVLRRIEDQIMLLQIDLLNIHHIRKKFSV